MDNDHATEPATHPGRLILSRKVGEQIVVDHPDGKVVLCVTRLRGGKVSIGIAAPKGMSVMRSELLATQ